MKKKILTISIILTILFLIVAVVFFFLMKNADDTKKKEISEEYDTSDVVESIKFLKFNTYDEIKKYADEYPVYIQTSDDKSVFAIGELYIKDAPVTLLYTLNDDNTINRFDGKYTYKLKNPSVDEVWNSVSYFNYAVFELFGGNHFEHSMYDEAGAPIDTNTEKSYELMLKGKAKYNLSIIDKYNTYWNISAIVTKEKQIEFEFFRCFDLSVYNDDSPNIDLRPIEKTGE